jgi:PEP-CTERM motif
MKSKFAATAVAVIGVGLAGVAHAQITSFATFSALTADNFYYQNASGSNASASSAFYSIGSPTGTTAAPVEVDFSFINLGSTYDDAVSNVVADLTWSSSSSTAAQSGFGLAIQSANTGTFTITSTTSIKLGSITYAAGSVLLAGTYTGGSISGTQGSTSGGFDVSNESGGTLTFTSDFLNFADVSEVDAALNLTSATTAGSTNKGLSSVAYGTDALRTFKTDAGGSFSADPEPTANGVPEPASWAMMLLGVAGIGGMIRRRGGAAAAI